MSLLARKLCPVVIAVMAALLYGTGAAGQDCEPAVDMMESNDAVNRIAECDYSDQGLNGWLQGRGDDTSPAQSQTGTKAVAEAQPVAAGAVFTLSRTSVASALDMLQARYALVGQAAQRCGAEAVLKEESYMPQPQGGTGLYMKFYCR
ncbi:hypothetical protein [uncultured Gilvimarinus sp.]|uniref:hypothetical protein n=1 Tax=uncultured Gilvimarinus sp. TaxID=1689143 RepID=UPI0030EE8B23